MFCAYAKIRKSFVNSWIAWRSCSYYFRCYDGCRGEGYESEAIDTARIFVRKTAFVLAAESTEGWFASRPNGCPSASFVNPDSVFAMVALREHSDSFIAIGTGTILRATSCWPRTSLMRWFLERAALVMIRLTKYFPKRFETWKVREFSAFFENSFLLDDEKGSMFERHFLLIDFLCLWSGVRWTLVNSKG